MPELGGVVLVSNLRPDATAAVEQVIELLKVNIWLSTPGSSLLICFCSQPLSLVLSSSPSSSVSLILCPSALVLSFSLIISKELKTKIYSHAHSLILSHLYIV